MSDTIELLEYWKVIRRFWMLVVAIPVIAALVSGFYSFFVIKPQYQADTTLLVNQKISSQMITTDTLTLDQMLVKTYSDIVKSRTIEEAVIAHLHLPFTGGQLDKMVAVQAPDQSQVFNITVTAGNQALAAQIANDLASTFQQKASAMMDIKNVQIIDPAVVQSHAIPVKPNKKLNVAIAFILGLMVGVGIAFLLEYLDNRIRNEDDVKKYLDLPVLGVIMDYESVNH